MPTDVKPASERRTRSCSRTAACPCRSRPGADDRRAGTPAQPPAPPCKASSGVMTPLARPRMPSVPKYLRTFYVSASPGGRAPQIALKQPRATRQASRIAPLRPQAASQCAAHRPKSKRNDCLVNESARFKAGAFHYSLGRRSDWACEDSCLRLRLQAAVRLARAAAARGRHRRGPRRRRGLAGVADRRAGRRADP